MPFKSESQRKFLFAKKPSLAKKWAHKYGTPKDLPEKAGTYGEAVKRGYKPKHKKKKKKDKK